MDDDNVASLMKKVSMDALILGIGDVAAATGVSQSQLRYWVRKGYIEATEMADGGNRKFSYKTVLKIQQIKTYLDDGYTLVSAVKRAQQRGIYVTALRSFFEERLLDLTMDDEQATIDLGRFDPDPTKELIVHRDKDTGWQFRLRPQDS